MRDTMQLVLAALGITLCLLTVLFAVAIILSPAFSRTPGGYLLIASILGPLVTFASVIVGVSASRNISKDDGNGRNGTG